MTLTLTIAYLVMAAAAAMIVLAASTRLGDEPQPATQRLGLSVAAGLVWPVVLIGLAELSSVAMYAKAHEHERVDALV